MSVEMGIRNKLRTLGYAAKLVNGDCFDIDQDGFTHYLSKDEAESLAEAGSGIDLYSCSEQRGLNRWYNFNKRGKLRP